jgi:hypothetical protein
MNKIIIAASIAGIAVAVSMTVGYFVYANPTSNPWDAMNCEEMMNLAMSPEHQIFTEQQHMQFHMKLAPCIDNTNHMQP